MINKRKLFISITMVLALIFSLTYCLADIYLMNKKNAEKENTAVATQNTEKNLEDETKICLISGDKTQDELSLKDFKSKYNLDSNMTLNNLCSELKEQGYELDGAEDSKLIFKKEASSSLKPNKYYIGEKDGYLAIYKTDENANAFIEKDQDVYRDNKKVDDLTEDDKTKIKNFEFEYDNKDDAEEDLSEFLS
ncbi:MAG: hypothetical protein Q4F66_13535 [Clostridium sp.]|nr:hypothetical protein [Clostridium sp.]